MITRILALVLLLITAGANARAPSTDAHAEAAAEVLTLIGIDAGVAPMMARMRDTTLAQIAALDVAPGSEEIAAPYMARIGAIIERTLAWDALRGDFVDAYAAKFSEQELRELADFFRSPVGARYLDNVTELNRLAVDIVRENALAAAPQIRLVTEEMQAALPERQLESPPEAP